MELLKNVKELTDDEAKEILNFVYPNDTDVYFKKVSFDSKSNEDGTVQLTFGMREIVGIQYHNGQDHCILHFDNTKVVLWLYKNNYDILKFLEANSYLSEMEKDFETFAFAIDWMAKGEEGFKDGYKQNWNLDYVTNKCKKLLEEYYYKDY